MNNDINGSTLGVLKPYYKMKKFSRTYTNAWESS